MGQIITFDIDRRGVAKKKTDNAHSRKVVQSVALTHISRASKLLAGLEGDERRYSWMLEDIASMMNATMAKRRS